MKTSIMSALLVAVFMLIAATMSGCSTTPTDAVDLDVLCRAMLAADAEMPEMSVADSNSENAADYFTYLSDIPYDAVDGYFFAYSAAGTACEIAAIRLNAGADMGEAMRSLEKHVDKRVASFTAYAPEQVAVAKDALIFSHGSLAVMIMGEHQQAVKAAFDAAVAQNVKQTSI